MTASSELHARQKSIPPDDAKELGQDIARVKKAWKKYQRSHRRNAVYRFLSAVFEIAALWQADGHAASRAQRALINERCKAPRSLDPFSALMVIAADPSAIDDRTLAKWSRALKYAAGRKPPSTTLTKFIRAKGGINDCAARFTRPTPTRPPP